jgi:hypothetical protein
MKSTFDEHVQRSLDGLKDFQRATVDVVYNNLFVNDQKRMLIADEVGLGKTKVANGIIARAIEQRLGSGNTKPLKVTYICSNQVIAQENIQKLDVYPDSQSYDRNASRLTYLAYKPKSQNKGHLQLNTLTPATSFSKGNSTGQQGERQILYSLLASYTHLEPFKKSLSAILRGNIERKSSEWYRLLETERKKPSEGKKLRANCQSRFVRAIKSRKIQYFDCPLFETLGIRRPISIYKALVSLCKLVNLKNYAQYKKSSDHMVRELKGALADVCVDYIDADLFILDEFQRFKELVSQDEDSDTSRIARSLFKKPDVKVILLSATPFKAYSGDSTSESADDHYKEFGSVLRFLVEEDTEQVSQYEAHRQALSMQLFGIGIRTEELDSTHRDAVQNFLRKIICRTERQSVSQDYNAMTVDKWHNDPVTVGSGDIKNFLVTDEIVQCLNRLLGDSRQPLQPPIEFCKSAPFPLSFLDDYKIKELLHQNKDEPEVQEVLKSNSAAWIDHKRIGQYAPLFDRQSEVTNTKFDRVLDEVLGGNGHNLLWVPPSLPYYPLTGAYSDSDGFTKTLVFSRWLMVPRMLASLISYEVERKTIGDPRSIDSSGDKERRKYFHGESQKRHPIPQIVFSRKRSETGMSAKNMSNMTLLYPSHSLADLFDGKDCLLRKEPLDSIRSRIVLRINELLERSKLDQFSTSDGESDKWYWAAPLLLDRSNEELRSLVSEWFDGVERTDDSDFLNKKHDGKSGRKDQTLKLIHFQELRACFKDPTSAKLGKLPGDLPEVLADIAIGNPANVMLRVAGSIKDTEIYHRKLFAFEMAGEFINLFNKPESIATVRLTTNSDYPYWRRVLEYCASGCLQSVMDEYVHLLQPDKPGIWDLYQKLVDSMNLGTSSIKVDDLSSFTSDERKNMRCHYAVEMGNQRLETDGGQVRIKGIRDAFNSPFRPFVLASTSIGQEGLDFHNYCRRIVHWNLPSNPIDIEQREGRINRFKAHVIRQQIAHRYGGQLSEEALTKNGVWECLFDLAQTEERNGKCDLVPYWLVESDKYKIERVIPFYPFSRDRATLSTLMKTLTLYRLAFGQPRQAELVEHLMANVGEDRIEKIRKKLMIDLCPISYLQQTSVGG